MKWLVRIFLIIILLAGLFILCGCSNESNNENNIKDDNSTNGYYTYMPVWIGKTMMTIPIWHKK